MMGFRVCGPKLSLCGALLSVWGILQLGLMAVFMYFNSVAFIEDLKLPEELEKSANTTATDLISAIGKKILLLKNFCNPGLHNSDY